MMPRTSTISTICIAVMLLVLLPPVAATSLVAPDTGTVTGAATAEDAEEAVETAEETVKEAEETVSNDDDADDPAEDALTTAKQQLASAKEALNRSAYNQSAAAAETAMKQAETAQKQAVSQRITDTRGRLDGFADTHNQLSTAVSLLADQDIAMNGSRAALNASSIHLEAADTRLATAQAHLDSGNVTAARDAVTDARSRLQQARQTLKGAPVKAEIQAGISAKVNSVAAMKAETKQSVQQAEHTFGPEKEKQAASRQYTEAEQAYEEGKQSQDSISSASSLADMASSAHQAATTLDTAEEQLASAQEHARQARNAFFRHALVMATFLAVMGGGGFLYYRMNGGYKPEETLDDVKKLVSGDSDGDADEEG